MKMKRPFILAGIILASAAGAGAHQPRLVRDKPSVEVRNPGISQAFYAWLDGSVQSYFIRSDVPFRLYVNLLVPDSPGIKKDFTAVIYEGDEAPDRVLARLEGVGFDWRPFFEPFGGDHYLVGPEFERDVGKGTYIVVVSNPALRGKYALAVGKIEKFPLREIVGTIRILPRLKSEFFGKSPLTGYVNLTGGFLLLTLAAAAAILSLIL